MSDASAPAVNGAGTAAIYERVVASLPGLCLAYDVQGALLAWNDALEVAAGLTRDELGARTLSELLPEAASALLAVGTRSGVAPPRGATPGVLRLDLVTRQGRRLALEGTVSPITAGGRVVGGVLLALDLREAQRRREQIVRVERLRALNELASGISHNFNNRLTVILGRAQLAARTARDEDLQADLEAIARAARQSADLVQRLQSSTACWEDRRGLPCVDINTLVREEAERARTAWRVPPQASAPEIRIHEDLADVAQPKGLADALRQVLQHMLDNARDAMPAGGTITLSTRQQGHWLLLRVSDTGEGMTEEVRRRAFDPLFTTKGPQSAGLGLSTAYGIVARHGGDIEIESIPGRGATFTVRLPTGGAPHPALPERPVAGGGQRILVVDDEGEICQMLTRLLEGEGYRVAVALDGQTALALCAAEGFDLVITELGMPDMSGWELADTLRRQCPDTRVLLMSGWELDVDGERLGQYNVHEVLHKPFEIRTLLDAVSRCLAASA
ncbi:MAG TPA: response regulator [Chloroflexi bacterium]|jgi:PAS domain S-box-containing protein|nr:response regulator [Chloroflexota bacterium]